MNVQQLDKFQKTRTGFSVFGLIELAVAYLFGSLAINSGSIWEWVLTVVFVLGFGQNFVKFMDTFLHGSKR